MIIILSLQYTQNAGSERISRYRDKSIFSVLRISMRQEFIITQLNSIVEDSSLTRCAKRELVRCKSQEVFMKFLCHELQDVAKRKYYSRKTLNPNYPVENHHRRVPAVTLGNLRIGQKLSTTSYCLQSPLTAQKRRAYQANELPGFLIVYAMSAPLNRTCLTGVHRVPLSVYRSRDLAFSLHAPLCTPTYSCSPIFRFLTDARPTP